MSDISAGWRIQELDNLYKGMVSAIQGQSDYMLAKACVNMRLFVDEIDPSHTRLIKESERLRDAAERFGEAMEGIDTEAIEAFVKLADVSGG